MAQFSFSFPDFSPVKDVTKRTIEVSREPLGDEAVVVTEPDTFNSSGYYWVGVYSDSGTLVGDLRTTPEGENILNEFLGGVKTS